MEYLLIKWGLHPIPIDRLEGVLMNYPNLLYIDSAVVRAKMIDILTNNYNLNDIDALARRLQNLLFSESISSNDRSIITNLIVKISYEL